MNNKLKISYIIILTIALFILSIIAFTIKQFNYINSYSKNRGLYDHYRIPLEYPYEMSAFDTLDTMNISTWKNFSGDNFISNVIEFRKQDHILAGKYLTNTHYANDKGIHNWFIFDCQSGHIRSFNTHQEYLKALKELGFSEEPQLLSNQENWNTFWKTGEWK